MRESLSSGRSERPQRVASVVCSCVCVWTNVGVRAALSARMSARRIAILGALVSLFGVDYGMWGPLLGYLLPLCFLSHFSSSSSDGYLSSDLALPLHTSFAHFLACSRALSRLCKLHPLDCYCVRLSTKRYAVVSELSDWRQFRRGSYCVPKRSPRERE